MSGAKEIRVVSLSLSLSYLEAKRIACILNNYRRKTLILNGKKTQHEKDNVHYDLIISFKQPEQTGHLEEASSNGDAGFCQR